MSRGVLFVSLIWTLSATAPAQFTVGSGHERDRGRREGPSFGGPAKGGYTCYRPTREHARYRPPVLLGTNDAMPPAVYQNVTVVNQIQGFGAAPAPQRESAPERFAIEPVVPVRAWVKPFGAVRRAEDPRLKSLSRDLTEISSARVSGDGPLSGATLVALRAKSSAEWTMTLCWEDADAFAVAHRNTPLQAWFETADNPKHVVVIGR